MDEHNGHAFLLSSIFFFFCEWRVVFLLSTSHAECAWYVCVCVCALRGCRTAEAAVSSRHRKQSLCLCCVCSSWVCLIYDTEGICAPSNGDLIIFLCSFFSCRPRLRILKKITLESQGWRWRTLPSRFTHRSNATCSHPLHRPQVTSLKSLVATYIIARFTSIVHFESGGRGALRGRHHFVHYARR